jgi:ribonuclease HI
MVREKRPAMVFLMETKMRRKKMENIRHKLGFPSMFVVDCVGRSGGLGLLWSEEVVVDIQNYSHRHINSIVHGCDNVEWKFTGFYGQPEAPRRHEAWALLKHLALFEPRPWMCMGDFNEIVNGTEKWGGKVRHRNQMQEFHQTLEECELNDLGYRGPKFTWSNCREGGDYIKERLDRGVANQEWQNLFPEAEVIVEAADVSDHSPLFLSLKKFIWRGKKKKPFRYEAGWAKEQGFQEAIITAWTNPLMQGGGWAHLENKINACKNEITKWKETARKPTHANIKSMRRRLAELQGMEQTASGDLIKKLTNDIQVAVEREDLWWRQRAKTEWLKQGDRNTKYFHACANSRRKKNWIEKIQDERGELWEESDGIGGAFVNYFEGLFTASRGVDMTNCLQFMEPRVTSKMNEGLLMPFTAEEIYAALNQMQPLKAPGPDGLHAQFFQQNWAVIGADICAGILDILNSGVMPPNLNMTHIVLIPKIKNPVLVSDFRPISLCNVLYKIISKVLANRLKKILPLIISPTQSAFIPGRLITDNLLAAYETLHTMHTRMGGKKGFMAVKVDMSKAYDRVEWRFLEGVMKKMGFEEGWIKLVMMCISSVKYSVIVNGDPCGQITPSRGIRQGDPISPYLFLLCAEALSSLVGQANRDGLLSGVPTSKRGPHISHLFFADDSLFFCRANIAQWSNLSAILRTYEGASGQKLNISKTAIFFSRNTPTAEKETILEFAGISTTNRYDTYLGLPAIVGRSRVKAFRSIVERVAKRLQDWKLRFLSQAGKEILLKAVVQAIPSYCMSVFLFPKTLSAEINSLMQRFWWGHKENDRRIPWISWSKMGRSKDHGGLGFRDLICFNKALLAKQVWRLWTNPNSLIAQIMRKKYHPDCSILDTTLGQKPSFAWRSIQSACDLVKEGLVWRVGNGKKIRIWKDRWLPQPSTFQVQSPPSILEPNAKVSQLLEDDGEWNLALLGQVFTVEEVEIIRTIPISSTDQEDRLIWRGTTKGVFTVKSAYHMQKELEGSLAAGCSFRRDGSEVWKRLWRLNIPNAEKVFFWRACQNILPTRDNLVRKKIIDDAGCPICGREDETISHILWSCPSAQDVWSAASVIFQKSHFEESSFLRIAEGMLKRCSVNEFQFFVVLARRIWLRRNALIHEGVFSHPSALSVTAAEFLEAFQKAQEEQKTPRVETGPYAPGQWKPPPVGWHKINWDAALGQHRDGLGLGIVVRDHMGKFVAARSRSRPGGVAPVAAEAMAALLAIRTAGELGLRQVCLEGDAKTIVDAVNSNEEDWSNIGHLVDDIRSEVRNLPQWTMNHVCRESNQAAHVMAKVAQTASMDGLWLLNTPDCILEILVSEQTALTHIDN